MDFAVDGIKQKNVKFCFLDCNLIYIFIRIGIKQTFERSFYTFYTVVLKRKERKRFRNGEDIFRIYLFIYFYSNFGILFNNNLRRLRVIPIHRQLNDI